MGITAIFLGMAWKIACVGLEIILNKYIHHPIAREEATLIMRLQLNKYGIFKQSNNPIMQFENEKK